MEYAADTGRLGEYIADARYKRPRKKAYLRMDRICFGIRIDCAAINRKIALEEIAARNPTWKKAQRSITPLVASIPPCGLNMGGPNARRKMGYRFRKLTNESLLPGCIPVGSLSSIHCADRIMLSASPFQLSAISRH
jgi:hypothetical protein